MTDNQGVGVSHLVLSLFPGIGLLDRGFEDEGFCVVRGPDLLWGGDVKKFHPPAGKFDGAIGGPPCQAFSGLANINLARGRVPAENLIPEYERCIAEAQPSWFVMENVPQAPKPQVRWYAVRDYVLNNRQFGGEQNRERRFSFGVHHRVRDAAFVMLKPRIVALEAVRWEPAVTSSMGGRRIGPDKGYKSPKALRERSNEERARLQGLPDDFDLPGFTVNAKKTAIANGVPYPLARGIALAVREALGLPGVAP